MAGSGALLLALVAGCSAKSADPGSDVNAVYRHQIDEALAYAPSELEQLVLTDYKVTDAEYQQAREALKACIEASTYGFTVTLESSGQTVVDMPAGFSDAMGGDDAAQNAVNTTVTDCQTGTIENIEPLYLGMRDNPQGFTPIELIRQCFARKGIQEGGNLSDQEFISMIIDDESYLPDHPVAQECVADPFG